MAVKDGMRPMHPGEILVEELEELGLTAASFAEALDMPTDQVEAILGERLAITVETALRLSRYFGTSAEVWLNLQKGYELRVAEIELGKLIEERVQPREREAVPLAGD